MKNKEIDKVFKILNKNNPSPTTELNYENVFTLLVAVVMSAQSTDKGVNKATDKLFKKAYGKRSNASLHSTTFNGIGTTCEVARESLKIISNEEFLQDVRNKGDYFTNELLKLKKE